MSVNWKYDLFFSFQIFNSLIVDQDVFSIIPTPACKKKLKKHNLIFKPTVNGALIIAEKRIMPDESTQVLRKIKELTTFTFAIILKKPILFPKLSPYNSDPDDTLPKFFGRNRLLYYDNLNNALQPDQDLNLISTPELKNIELSHMDIAVTGTSSIADLASLVPNKFSYHRKAGVSQIVLRPQTPNSTSDLVYSLTSQKPAIELSLSEGAYRFEQIGISTPSEMIFAGSELLNINSFGVVSIYKNESTDYNMAIQYNINFEEPQNTN